MERPEDGAFFSERYARPISDAARALERMVFGHEVGLNGFTTLDQAERLGDLLDLRTSSILLDVGAGRGWPGVHLAASRRCRTVLADIPIEALRRAPHYARRARVPDLVSAVCADGRALPFASASFHALVHADVLC